MKEIKIEKTLHTIVHVILEDETGETTNQALGTVVNDCVHAASTVGMGAAASDVRASGNSIDMSFGGDPNETALRAAACVTAIRRVVIEQRREKRNNIMMRGAVIQTGLEDLIQPAVQTARLLAVSGPAMQTVVTEQVAESIKDKYELVERLPFEIYNRRVRLFYLGNPTD